MITYIKTAFTNPREIYIGRNMKNSHFFYLILLFSGLISLILFFQYIPLFNQINDDFFEIKESIPEFELANDELTSDSESYVYQTDSMVFYFDPDDTLETETIDQNATRVNAPLSTALLSDGMYATILGQGYYLSYDQFDQLTTNDIENLIDSFGTLSTTTKIAFVLVVFIMQILLFVYELIPITLFANIISIASRLRLTLFQNFKISLLAFIPPVVGVQLIRTFIYPIRFTFEIVLVMSLITYYLSIKELKTQLNNQSEQ